MATAILAVIVTSVGGKAAWVRDRFLRQGQQKREHQKHAYPGCPSPFGCEEYIRICSASTASVGEVALSDDAPMDLHDRR
jgi:hypothetical protein